MPDDAMIDEYGSSEQRRRETMERIAKSLIVQMGGEVIQEGHKFSAEHWVYYHPLTHKDFLHCPPDKQPQRLPPRYKRIHWLYITECFFAYGRRDMAKFILNLDKPASDQQHN